MRTPAIDLNTILLMSPPDPVGSYERGVFHNGVGMLSGQFPIESGRLVFEGRVGDELTEEQGVQAARLAAINAIAQIAKLLGGLDTLVGILRVDGFVSSADDFWRQPAVLDGASNVLVQILGERGKHARSAISVPRLPLNSPIELVITFAVGPSKGG